MEVLARYGTPEQKERWLEPLLAGEIRSCFAMTEPDVASSDATNIQSTHRARRRRVRHQRPQVVDLRRRRSALQDRHLHGQDRSRRRRTAQAAVDDPRADGHPGRHHRADADRVRLRRCAARPRGGRCSRTCACRRRTCCSARAAASRSRRAGSGPGRIHHCMRLIGAGRARAGGDVHARRRRASRSASRWPSRARSARDIAESRIEIEQARLLTLKAAYMMDTVGQQGGPRRDRDDQGGGAEHGAAGDRPRDPGARRRRRERRLPSGRRLGHARTLRLADGRTRSTARRSRSSNCESREPGTKPPPTTRPCRQ